MCIRDRINAGVSGYVVKSGAAQDLVEAIRTGSRGKIYFSEEIAEAADGIQNNKGKRKRKSSQTECPLTQREREVLQLIGEGYSSVEIASKLKIRETTVKTHRNNLMDKLCVRSVAGLTRQAIRLKLVHVEWNNKDESDYKIKGEWLKTTHLLFYLLKIFAVANSSDLPAPSKSSEAEY